jgi:hypothetical protein
MDVTISVSSTATSIRVKIGSITVDLPQADLQKYMDVSLHNPVETVIRNICLRLSLAGVNPMNMPAVITALNGVMFKAVGGV